MAYSDGNSVDLQDTIHKIESEQAKGLVKEGRLNKSLFPFLYKTNEYVIQTFSAKVPVKTKLCFISYDESSPHEVFYSTDNGKTYNYIYSSAIDVKLAKDIPSLSRG